MGLSGLLALYLGFRLKQLLCDFIQPSWVAMNKHQSLQGLGGRALFVHCGAHAVGTFILVMIFAPQLWWLAVIDFFVHASIDRFKAKFVHYKKWSMQTIKYWFIFGLDQEAHNLTHLSYVILIFMTLNPDLTL